ncbi:MAG: 50S ribosomal protein L30 [Anaerolineae bacterium]|nr:50S ribosomal protein L30 [Anaerolineae bacterium]
MASKKEATQKQKALRITLVKSPIGYEKSQGATARSLGLRRMNATVVHNDTPQIRGMVYKIRHLVTVEEVE